MGATSGFGVSDQNSWKQLIELYKMFYTLFFLEKKIKFTEVVSISHTAHSKTLKFENLIVAITKEKRELDSQGAATKFSPACRNASFWPIQFYIVCAFLD